MLTAKNFVDYGYGFFFPFALTARQFVYTSIPRALLWAIFLLGLRPVLVPNVISKIICSFAPSLLVTSAAHLFLYSAWLLIAHCLLYIKGDPPAVLRDADGFCYRLIR